jgi:hypothetical protein
LEEDDEVFSNGTMLIPNFVNISSEAEAGYTQKYRHGECMETELSQFFLKEGNYVETKYTAKVRGRGEGKKQQTLEEKKVENTRRRKKNGSKNGVKKRENE